MRSGLLPDADRKEDFLLRFLIDKKYRIIRHIFILLFLFFGIINYKIRREFDGNYEFYNMSIAYVDIVIMFYINMYFLIPKILYKRKYFYYLTSLAIMITVTFFISDFYNKHYIEPHRIMPVDVKISYVRRLFAVNILAVPFILSSTALKLFQRWIKDTSLMNELEKHALHVELEALKNQINPHFLFNMLNNVNVLIKKDPEKASLITIKLSNFLRYNLYENNKAKVFLLADIKFLNDFLNLEKIRQDDFDFSIEKDDYVLHNIQIPPNIFTTFVENAVKHSIDTNSFSYVRVIFKLHQNQLCFTCCNSKPVKKRLEEQHQGLGLANIKRTLHLLYGESFHLTINDGKENYTINLILPV